MNRVLRTTFCCVLLLFSLGITTHATSPMTSSNNHLKSDNSQALQFVPNVGQWPSEVRFQMQQANVHARFLEDKISFLMQQEATNAYVWNMRFQGAMPASIQAKEYAITQRHFIQTDGIYSTKTAKDVWYENLYEGIDLKFYDNGEGQLEYDFHLAPLADPAAIRLQFQGIDNYYLDAKTGELILQTPLGKARQSPPLSYQMIGGQREIVTSTYRQYQDGSIGFELGTYDTSCPLVIDPILLEWGTALYEGSTHDLEKMQDTDFVYTGQSVTTGFVTATAGAANYPGTIVNYASKLSNDGITERWTALFHNVGISGYVAVEELSNGDVVIAFSTDTTVLPTTDGSTHAGITDMYIAILDGTNGALKMARYFGAFDGEDWTSHQCLTVDASDNIYLALRTSSGALPLSAGAYATFGTAYVLGLDSNLNFIYGTYTFGAELSAILISTTGDIILRGFEFASQGGVPFGPVAGTTYVDLADPNINLIIYGNPFGVGGLDFLASYTPDLTTLNNISYYPVFAMFGCLYQVGSSLYIQYNPFSDYYAPPGSDGYVLQVPENDLGVTNFIPSNGTLCGVSPNGDFAFRENMLASISSDALHISGVSNLSIYNNSGDFLYGTYLPDEQVKVCFDDCEFYVYSHLYSLFDPSGAAAVVLNTQDVALTAGTLDPYPVLSTQGYIQKFSYQQPDAASNVLPDYPGGTTFCINGYIDVIDGPEQLTTAPTVIIGGNVAPYPNPNPRDQYLWQYSTSGPGGPWVDLPGSNSEDLLPPLNSVTGTYHYRRLLINPFCPDMFFASNAVEVVVNTLIAPALDMGDAIIACPGDVITLSPTVTPSGTAGVTGYNYTWSPTVGIVSGAISGTLPATGGVPSIDVMVPGTEIAYVLSVTDDIGCRVVDAVTVTGLTLDAGDDITVCDGMDVVIGPTISDPSHMTYLWTPNTGLSADNVQNPTVDVSVIGLGTTVYTLVVNGCVAAADNVEVTVVNPPSLPGPLPLLELCQGELGQLGDGNTFNLFYDYDWVPGFGVGNSQNPLSDYQYNIAGDYTYYLTAIDPNTGCASVITQDVSIYHIPQSSFDLEISTCNFLGLLLGSMPTQADIDAGIIYSWTATVDNLGNSAGTGTIPSDAEALGFLDTPTDGQSGMTVPATHLTDVCYDMEYIRTSINPDRPICMRMDTLVVHYCPCTGVGDGGYSCSIDIPNGQTSLCAGDMTLLNPSPYDTIIYEYYWSPITDLFDPNTGLALTGAGPHPAIVNADPSMNTVYTLIIIDTRTNATACMEDILVTAAISSTPNIDNPNVEVCVGENINIGGAAVAGLNYQWSPSAYLDNDNSSNPVFNHTVPGTYNYTLIATEPLTGCTDTAQVVVDISDVNGDLGGDIDFCGTSGLVAMVGVDSFPNYTYQSLSPIAANLDDPINWATNSSTIFTTTTFILEITNELGCTIQDTVIYTDVGAPNPTTGAVQYSCNGGMIELGIDGELDESIYDFSWSGPGGFSSTMQSTSTNIPATGAGPWVYTLTVSQGADPACSTSVNWVVEPLPMLTFLPTDVPCDASGVLIGVDFSSIPPSEAGNYTYMWDNISGITDISYTSISPTISVYPSTPQLYNITVTHTPSGCEQTFMYNIAPPSMPADLGPDLVVCADDTNPTLMLQSAIAGAMGYTWSGDGAPYLNSTTIANPTFDIAASIAANGSGQTYTLVITVMLGGGCIVQDEIMITVYGTLEQLAGGDQIACAEEKIVLGLPMLPGHTYTWTPVPYDIDLANNIINPNSAQPTICVTETATYKVTYTSVDGSCMGMDLVSIIVPVENPVLDVMDIEQCANDGPLVDLNDAIINNTGTTTSFWYDPTLIAPIPDPTNVPSGTYYIESTNTEGCFDVDTVMVTILPEPIFTATGIINCGDDSMSEITLSGFDAGLHYDVVMGSTYTGSGTYASTSPIPTDGNLGTFTGSMSGTTYTIRVFDANGCYTDHTVTLESAICDLLPIELLTFYAEEKDCDAHLSWRTAAAIEFSHFELEQSLDGKNFEPIAKVEATANTIEEQVFSFIQPNLKSGITYFRLRQVDLDGSFEYSDIVAVKAKCTGGEDRFHIHPNPTASLLYLEYTATTAQTLQVEITSMSGIVLRNLEFELNAGKQNLNLDLADLAAGTYLIRLSNTQTGEQSVERIIKAR